MDTVKMFWIIYTIIGVTYGASATSRADIRDKTIMVAGFILFSVFWWFFLPTRVFSKYLR
jgi:hypothetical protein